MSLDLEFALSEGLQVRIDRCVVRVKTSYWSDDRGAHTKRSLNVLRRQCEGYNILEEDCQDLSTEEVMRGITNLHDVEDGIYELIMANKSYDLETGYVEDYDYTLVELHE